MPGPTVLIVGCGVAGPVVASFYKRRGYQPIVFEKVAQLGDAGASVMLMPNGINVLHLLGVAHAVAAESSAVQYLIEKTAAGDVLAETDLPSSFAATYGQPAVGVKRTSLNLMLKDLLLAQDIELREGWKLVDIRESEHDVTAIFDNGESVTGDFLVGCDGIKSATRDILLSQRGLEQQSPEYTGLVQMSGISKTPSSLLAKPAVRNWYGQGLHMIAYPVSKTHTSWAVTMREEQREEESWRLYSPQEIAAQTAALATRMKGWESVVRDMILAADRIVKFGIFDRNELQPAEWYSKRCVLIGDAAHATSPHLGQGANQALEDSYRLTHSMPSLDSHSGSGIGPGGSIADHSLSEAFFGPMAEERQPRTSKLVKTARAIGELRVESDAAKCKQRDATIASDWMDRDKMEARLRDLLTAIFPALQ